MGRGTKSEAKETKQTAIQVAGSVQMASPIEMQTDLLAGVFDDEEEVFTGTEEMGAEDVRLPTWALNTKGNDRVVTRPNEFLNTVTEEVKERLHLAILTNHKTRQWRENGADNKPVVRCRSFDNVTGEMEDGTKRSCAGCPDYEWKTDPQTGKRSRRCGDVYNLVGIDRENGQMGVLRVKKGSIKAVKEFYQRHFYKKRRTAKGYVDYPFFAFETIVGAKMEKGEGFTWAVPTFELGGLLPPEEIRMYSDLARSLLDEQKHRLTATIDAADKGEAEDVIETTGGPVGDMDGFEDDDVGPTPESSSAGYANAGANANAGAGASSKRF